MKPRVSSEMKTLVQESLVVLIGVIGILMLLFHHVFSNPFYYLAADINELYFPWWVFINHAMHLGFIPILNQYWFGGSLPFAALESSVFYPPFLAIQTLFNAAQNLDSAYFFHLAMEWGHYLLGGVSFYLLLRTGLRLNRFSSVFGGIIYATSGVFIGRFVHPVILFTLAWLPLLYLFFLLFVERLRPIYALATTLILSMIILSGHPQFIFYVFCLFAFAALYATLTARPPLRIKIIISSIFIVVLSVGLTAFKILLTLELGQEIIRTTTETTIKNLYNSIHPLYYLTLVVPYLFGKHVVGYWGSDYPWGNWENFLYIGIIPLLFLPFSLFWKKKSLLLFFLVNFALVIFLLLGKYNGLSAAVNRYSPFSDQFTMISKYSNFLHFFLVILISIGIHEASRRSRRSLLIGSFSIAAIGLVLLWVNPGITTALGFASRPAPTASAIAFIGNNIDQAKILFVLSAIGFLLFLSTKYGIASLFLVAIFAMDIFLSAGEFNPIEASPGPPSLYFGDTPMTNFLKQNLGLYRVDNLWPRNINMISGIESTYGYHTIETKSYRSMISLFSFGNRSILDLMNVKYFITDKDISSEANMRPTTLPTLWENMSVLPRVFFVPSSRTVRSEQEMIQAISSPLFNPRQDVVLLSNSGTPEAAVHAEQIPNSASVEITSYEATELKANVAAPQSGFLVFSQFQYPGWKATIDGKPASLLAADLSLYALPITTGSHVVRFYYQSDPFIIGIAIALFSGTVLVIPILIPKWRRYYFLPLGSSSAENGHTDAVS